MIAALLNDAAMNCSAKRKEDAHALGEAKILKIW